MKRSHYIAVLALTSLVSTGCLPMRSVESQPINRVARWGGFGFSDGYHRCPSPCNSMAQYSSCPTCMQPIAPMHCAHPGVMPAGHFGGPASMPGQVYYAPQGNHGVIPNSGHSPHSVMPIPADNAPHPFLESPIPNSDVLIESSDIAPNKSTDAKAPETKSSVEKAPEVKKPDAKATDAKSSEIKEPELKTPEVKKPEPVIEPSPSDIPAAILIPPQVRQQMIMPAPVVYQYGPIPYGVQVAPGYPVYNAYNYAPTMMMPRPQIR
jgi:hypothetical protein